MEITHPLPILTRLTQVIDAFIAAIWNYRMPRHDTPWGVIPPIEFSIISRVRTRMGLAERALKALMARFRAGKLRPPTRRKASTTPRTRTEPKLPKLPRHFGWLCPLMPAEAGIRGNYLALILAEPEMQALLTASHRARNILKPICRMLAIDPRVLQPATGVPLHAESGPPAPTSPSRASDGPEWEASPQDLATAPDPRPVERPVERPVPS